jgi:dihydroflavonol-4-reductase
VAPLAVVTGASGFVGGAVARRLLEEGYDVRAVARSRAAAAAAEAIVVDGRAVRAVPGDVLERGSLAEAFDGADVVAHAAGIVRTCMRDPSPMIRANVIGTRNAVGAAADARVGRFVLTSSAATIGERQGETGRETTPHRGWFLSVYERSKVQAEATAFALGRDRGLEVVSVNPASVQGPGRAEGTARLLLAAARGRLPFFVPTTVSFVDVDDCARAHVLAATRGTPGERYVLCGATMTTDEALAIVERLSDGVRRRIAVPARVVERLADVVDAGFRLAGRDAPLCREVAIAIRHGRRYDGSKAQRDLGIAYTEPERTIQRTLDWFRSSGLLAP